ncbi:PREDICTED: thioredoxin, mitochondrial isoform X1 [Gavialis gangeticus]|uniref:thioredoxin, mitochondrial isoform X1 n=1 Tax=Gavialis gangeticus TaxID=94835 RepID=UPI00092E48C3|nr:PREDICTED: thioredoxin, mitochondrial isoform X1 [Gavialis gangeticus]
MAQTLAFKRLLASSPKKLSAPFRSQPALLLSRASSVPSRPRSLLHQAQAPLLPSVKTFSTTPLCRSTFNIQDGEDFQDRVINSAKPVVIDFHAQWCGPCKILGPRLEKMVAKQRGKVLMAKVDIDDHTDLAIEYEAESLLLLQCSVLIRVLTKASSLLSCLFLTNCQKARKRKADKVLWVSAVPTVLAMKNGDVVDKFVGIKDEDQLEAFLKKLIKA